MSTRKPGRYAVSRAPHRLAGPAPGPDTGLVPQPRVADRLAEVIASAPGRASVAVRASCGLRWDHDADRVVPSVSTVKVAILLAVLGSGIPLQEPLPLPAERAGGCGPLSLLPSVRALPAGELARIMIALSDNDAANTLLDVVGFDAVAAVLDRAGARHTVVRRHFMDLAAAREGRDNLTSAADQADVLAALREGRLLGPTETELAMEVLRQQQFVDGLPAYLPSRVRVASKTGERPGMRHVVGVLEGGREWVAVAVLITDLLDPAGVDRGTLALATQAAVGECLVDLV